MKRWTIIRYILLGIVIWTLIMVLSILSIHLFGPHSPCLVPQSAATPTLQEKAMGVKIVCREGIPRQLHSSTNHRLPDSHQLTPNGGSILAHTAVPTPTQP